MPAASAGSQTEDVLIEVEGHDGKEMWSTLFHDRKNQFHFACKYNLCLVTIQLKYIYHK